MKNSLKFILNNAASILIMVLIVVAASIYSIRGLNIEAFPDPAPPIIEIVSIYNGRSGEEAERQITVPLEIALAGMPGLENINTISIYGLSDIKCKFSYNVDYRQAKQEVINRLAQAQIPSTVQPQIVANPIGEIMRYQVVGNRSLTELRTYQDWVVSRYLKTVPDIDDISSYGGFIKNYSVVVKPDNLLKYKVNLSDVIDALSKSNTNVGGRVLEFGDQYYTIRGLGLIKQISDIQKTVVAYKANKPIFVENIADVKISNVARTAIVGQDKQNDIVMGVVVLRKNAKSVDALTALHAKIKDLNTRILPKDIKVVPFYDRSDLVENVVGKIKETATVGIILVLVIIMIFLGDIKSALITAMIIPISLLYTLALMSIQGESANLLSLGAIDFGIIVDIPLLLIENYFRLKHEGNDHIKSISQTITEIGKPMMFSILIIFLAFIPLFAMKGAESQIFLPTTKTYIYAILFALLLTFTYLIAATYKFLGKSRERVLPGFNFIKNAYLKLISKVNPKFSVISVILFIGLTLFFTQILGSSFLPKMDEGNIYMRITFPYSISLQKSYENAKKVRDALINYPEIKSINFKAGRPEDGTDPTGPFNTEYSIQLKNYSEWKKGETKSDLEERIKKQLDPLFPNEDISLSQYIEDNLEEAMSGVKGENSVKLFGDDLNKLDGLAKKIEARLNKVSGLSEVGIFKEIGQPNLIIEANREKIATYGLNVSDVMDVVSSSLDGKNITKIVEGDKSFDLVVKFPDNFRQSLGKIKDIPILLSNGGIIPLSKITDIYYDTGASFIYRENFARYIPIKFSVESKDLAGTVAKAKLAIADIEKDLPDGYFITWSGRFQQMQEAFLRLSVTTPIALFLIFMVLFIYYGSVRNTIIILVAPILAFFGGVTFLLIWQEPLSISASVGFISILGVSILNASIMVSHYIQMVQNGMNSYEARIKTADDKFRAILMTGLTASIGLLPASVSTGVGSQVQKPLAIVVVGGMLLGTLLLLILMPSLLKYLKVENKKTKIGTGHLVLVE
ncbi:MAG: efflux RND transporter permease subunit [Candidatus Sericytochromatia bacterium]|nr:efflux RND transporter permease subunit [Candidatus Sericytochromatia bacterium]